MNVTITRDYTRANAITHGGKFHADEVMATVILGKVLKKLVVYRTFKVPKDINKDTVVYDIGLGKFDHHQNGGNGERMNGVPYAACGLIWKEYGRQIVADTCNPDMVFNIMDRELMQGIDATDNGDMPNVEYPCHNMSFTTMISMFNPNWDDAGDFDINFVKAVTYAETVFDNVKAYATAKASAKEHVDKAITKAENHIMVLDQYLPWQSYVLCSQCEKAPEILFTVYPSKRGGYNIQGVPESFNSFSQRKALPKNWRGLDDEELRKVTGVATARFCHPAGFVGGAETLEGALAMAKLAVEA